ncbi:MAG: YbaK/EbsC family protein [Anaerolineae bacterium]|nr:YbaK/EbsC family protein [Anaerolineae bacterium]
MYPVYEQIITRLQAENVHFTLHEHQASFTVADAEAYLSFPLGRLIKTIAFKHKNGQVILAGVLSTTRIDYRRLAEACQTQRALISSLSPQEVQQILKVEPGCVGPLTPLPAGSRVLFDTHSNLETSLFFGCGRPDRTLEMQPADLFRLSQACLADLVKNEGF